MGNLKEGIGISAGLLFEQDKRTQIEVPFTILGDRLGNIRKQAIWDLMGFKQTVVTSRRGFAKEQANQEGDESQGGHFLEIILAFVHQFGQMEQIFAMAEGEIDLEVQTVIVAAPTGSCPLSRPIATVQLRWDDPDTHQVTEIAPRSASTTSTTWDLAASFESADPRYQLTVVVAQYAELLRYNPLRLHSGQAWAAGTSASQLVEHAYHLSSLLWDGPVVVEFAIPGLPGMVSRANQIRALGQ